MRRLNITQAELRQVPVEVGLQTDNGYPLRGTLDHIAPSVNQATGTLAVRAILPNTDGVLMPGFFVRIRMSADERKSLLVPDVALGSDQGGRYVLIVNKDNVVEQRKVAIGPKVGDLRAIDSGLLPDDRVVVAGILRADSRPEGRSAATDGRHDAGIFRRRQVAGGPVISDFFISRPVLANVLAVLIVVIGAVALLTLPVAQYPDVVPPTVEVIARYPGASPRTVIDAVALPIEQQVNGVEGMIYMKSYSAADGSYTLTVTFKIGVDLNVAQILVQNRVSSALSSLPQSVQAQGVVVQKKSTAILQIVTLTSPDARYDSLYLANYATIKLKDEISTAFRRGQRGRVRRRPVFDARLARPQQDAGARTGAAGRDPGVAAAERASHGGSDRRAADAFRAIVPIHPQRRRQAQRSDPVRRRDREDRSRRRNYAGARCCQRRAWIADLRTGLCARRQTSGGPGDLPGAGRECARRCGPSAQENELA